MKKRTGIGFRIISMAIALSVIAAIIGCTGLFTTKKTSELAVEMYQYDLLGVQYAQNMEYLMQTSVVNSMAANRPGKTSAEINSYKQQFVETFSTFDKAIADYEQTIATSEEKTLIKTIKSAVKDYTAKGLLMFNYTLKGDLTGANEYIDSVLVPIRNNILDPAIEKLVKLSTGNGQKAYILSEHISSLAITIIIIAIFAGLAVSLTLGIAITRSITKPVSKMVSNLSDSSGQISISSTQLSASSQEIANGAQEQAASIEETTSSVEELSSMVKQNLGNTRQASLLSEKATEASQNGYDKMTEMLSAMNGISKSTEDIKNVIDVIDDIAFQTNMLALNAAVEAARAGEAGMGFAVVADEVKNLANRSSESAKETAAMIKETLKNVETGMSISNDLSEIFKEILTNSKKVMEMNREVETASGQQDEGIGQINTAMVQFDTVVQTNASSAEETASAAEELQGQVGNLNEIVDTLYVIVTGNEYSQNLEDQHTHSIPGSQSRTASRRTTGVHSAPTVSSQSSPSASVPHATVTGRKSTAETNNRKKAMSGQEKTDKKDHAISFEDDEEFKPV